MTVIFSIGAANTRGMGALGYGIIIYLFVAPAASLCTIVALAFLINLASYRENPIYVLRFLVLLLLWIVFLAAALATL